MTEKELLSFISINKVKATKPLSDKEIINTNNLLQQIGISILPAFLINLYKKTGTLNLGNAYIFAPNTINRLKKAPIPSIVDVNKKINIVPNGKGITIFGRNDLFLFACDSLGGCFMLDALTLKKLKQYDNPYKAIYDCLIIGKL